MLQLYVRFITVLISILSAVSVCVAGNARFHSEHFRFIADEPVNSSVQASIIEVAEATHEFLALWGPSTATLNTVRLFHDELSYLRAGGIEGSGGVHCSEREEVLLRLYDEKPNSLAEACRRVLVHEITHLLLDPMLEGAPPWLMEGIATYMESIPFHAGQFREGSIHFSRAPLLRGCTNQRIQTIQFSELLRTGRREWNANFTLNAHGVNRYYKTAYLLTYYLVHFQAAPSSRPFRQFLAALSESLQGATSPDKIFRTGAYEPSLAECNALQSAFVRAFSKENVQVSPMTGTPLLP